MGQKHILLTFLRAPYGTIFYTEGLRAAVGVTAGIDENTVDVLYMGDGAFFTLKGVDRTDSNKYLGTLAKAGYRLQVDEDSLNERSISREQVAEDVRIIPRAEVLSLINKADATIDF